MSFFRYDISQQQEQSLLPDIFILIFAGLFLLGMHYFQFNFGGSGLHLPFNVSSWLFISGLVSIVFLQIAKNKSLIYSQFSLHFMLVVALLSIPLCYFLFLPFDQTVTEQSIPRLLALFVGALLFIGFQQFQFTKAQIHLMMYTILLAVIIEAFLGMVQFYLMGLWPLINGKIIGFNPELMRPFGIFQQPNVMATFMSTGLMLSLYLLLKDTWYKHNLFIKVVLYSVPLAASLLLILNLSRTGMISAVIGIAILLPLAFKTKPKATLYWLLLLIIGIALAVLSFELADKTGRDITQMVKAGARLPTYLHSLEMIMQKPLFGWGYGSFETAFLSSSRAVGDVHNTINFGHLDHPHNELLYWLIEGGLLPLLAFFYAAWMIVGLFLNVGERKVGKKQGIESLALLALVLPILLHTQTEYPFYHAIVLWIIFVFLLFYIDSQTARYKSFVWPPSLLLQGLALVIPIFMAWFLFTTLSTCYYLGRYELGGSQHPSLLSNISNPIAFQTRFDWNFLSYKFILALEQGDKQGIKNMENWAEQTTQYMPRPEFYRNWLISLKEQGKDEQANTLLNEAERLYPNYFN